MSHILETPGGCVYPYVICDKTNSKSKCFLKKKKSQHCFFQVKVLVSWLEHYFSLFKKKKKEQQ